MLYTVAVVYTFVYVYTLFTNSGSNTTFPYIFPVLLVFLLFGDRRVVNSVAVIQFAANMIMVVKTVAGAEVIVTVMETAMIETVVSALGCVCVIVANRLMMQFDIEKQQAIQKGADRQSEMAAEVVDYAKCVLADMEDTKRELDKICETTQIINEALTDISESTASTAEAVDHQTRMTGSIQDVIQETYEKTTGIVGITAETSDVIEGGVRIADQTRTATENITNILDMLVLEAQSVSEKVEGTVETSIKQSELIGQTNQSFMDIQGKMQELNAEIQMDTFHKHMLNMETVVKKLAAYSTVVEE